MTGPRPDGPAPDQPDLARLLAEVGAVTPLAGDHGAQLRGGAGRRRLAVLGAGLGTLAVVVVVGLVALGHHGGSDEDLGDKPQPFVTSDAPQPSEEPAPTRSAAPAPTPAPRPSPTPGQRSVAPVPTTAPVTDAPLPPPPPPAPETTAPAVVVTTAAPPSSAPSPAATYVGKGLSVRLSHESNANREVRFSIGESDTDGYVQSAVLEFGDGNSVDLSSQLGPDHGGCSGTAPQRQAHSAASSHTYATGKTYYPYVTVTTGSSCRSTPSETGYASDAVVPQ